MTAKTIHTTPAFIESLAQRTNLPIEFTHDAAFLVVGDVEWYAILPSVGGAA